jgi:hypothetical protein
MKRVTMAYVAGVSVTLVPILGFLASTIYNAQSAQGEEDGGNL